MFLHILQICRKHYLCIYYHYYIIIITISSVPPITVCRWPPQSIYCIHAQPFTKTHLPTAHHCLFTIHHSSLPLVVHTHTRCYIHYSLLDHATNGTTLWISELPSGHMTAQFSSNYAGLVTKALHAIFKSTNGPSFSANSMREQHTTGYTGTGAPLWPTIRHTERGWNDWLAWLVWISIG